MIEAKGLVKTFDGTRALDGASLFVPKGSVYGLVGSNGAGKTTIIQHLAGVYKQDEGTVEIEGKPVFENNEVKQRTVLIPDDIYFFPQSTTLDMKEYLRGIYPKFDRELFERLSTAFPVDPKRQMRKLSKGMKKQSAFRLAVSCMPDVLLLDEPVDGLDPIMRRQVWQILLESVADRGVTVLVSSHNLRELEDVCDRVGIMHMGRIILERSLSELQDNVVKLQFALESEEEKTLEGVEVLHKSRSGRLTTLILRCGEEEARRRVGALSPLFFDVLPLTLEEVFIYELGGENYGVTV